MYAWKVWPDFTKIQTWHDCNFLGLSHAFVSRVSWSFEAYLPLFLLKSASFFRVRKLILNISTLKFVVELVYFWKKKWEFWKLSGKFFI